MSYPANPLDAMRELQELNELGTGQGGLRERRAAGSAVAPADGSEVGSATGSQVAKKVARERVPPEPQEEPAASNPLASALREMLGKPYPQGARESFTVSTVKIPTEVWERLGFAATLTGRPKQEVIAEALKDYFKKILKGG